MIWLFVVQLVVHVKNKSNTFISLNLFSNILVAPLANKEFHEQYNPPPAGGATGFNGQEQVFPTKDTANDMEQLQHRITQFQDSYPRIEKFYSQYSKVVVVDETASDTPLDEDQLYHELWRAVETHIDEEQAKIRQAEEERQRAEDERLAKEQEEQEAKQRAEEEAAKAQQAAEAVNLTHSIS
jgi:membrane protein involved in colicin uptake